MVIGLWALVTSRQIGNKYNITSILWIENRISLTNPVKKTLPNLPGMKLQLDAEFIYFAVERRKADAEQVGGFVFVEIDAAQNS